MLWWCALTMLTQTPLDVSITSHASVKCTRWPAEPDDPGNSQSIRSETWSLHCAAEDTTHDGWHTDLKSHPPLNDLTVKPPIESTEEMQHEIGNAIHPSSPEKQDCCAVFGSLATSLRILVHTTQPSILRKRADLKATSVCRYILRSHYTSIHQIGES